MDEIDDDDALSSVLTADGNGSIYTVENEMPPFPIMIYGEVLALTSCIQVKAEPMKGTNMAVECDQEKQCWKEEVNGEANDGRTNNEGVNDEENVNREEMNAEVNNEPNVAEVLTNQEVSNEESAKEVTNEDVNIEGKTNEELMDVEENDEENIDGDLVKEIVYHIEYGNEAAMNEQDLEVEKANEEMMNDRDANQGMKIEQNGKEEVENDNELKAYSKKKVSRRSKVGKLGKKKKITLMVTNAMIHDSGKKGVRSKKKADKPVRRGKLGKKKKIVPVSVNEVISIDEENEKAPEEACLVAQVEEMKELIQDEISGEEVEEEGNMQEETINGGNTKGKITKEEVKNETQAKENLKKKSNKQRKKKRLRGKSNIASSGMNEEELPSKGVTTVTKKTLGGIIFMCSSKTKKDCYRYNVLGLPAGKREIVLKITKGMKLFLYNFDLKLLYGIYEAAGPGGYNIESEAFKSRFPSQVRFKVYEDCSPLPEEKFRKVIEENYYQKKKFDCQLTFEQVKNLCKLFRAGRNGSKLTQMQRSSQVTKHTAKGRDKSRKRRRQAETETSKFVDRKRSRKRSCKQDMHCALGRDQPCMETHGEYVTEAYESRAALMRLHAPFSRPPPAIAIAPSAHAYEGTLERNVYRGDPLSEHQDMRCVNLEWRHRDPMTSIRASSNDHPDGRYLDSEFRYREGSGHRDPYVQYWNHTSYCDLSYPAAHTSEYPPRTRPSHDLAALRPEYWPHRAAYRY